MDVSVSPRLTTWVTPWAVLGLAEGPGEGVAWALGLGLGLGLAGDVEADGVAAGGVGGIGESAGIDDAAD